MLDSTWCRELFGALEHRFAAEEDYLNGLDAAIGDGDHGSSMLRGIKAAVLALTEKPEGSIADIFKIAGMAFISKVGGVSGVIFGQLFVSFGIGARDADELLPINVQAMLSTASADIHTRGKVSAGDKSMFDALHCAAEAGGTCQDDNMRKFIMQVAEAAAQGRDNTISMVGAVGRARYQGENGVGHMDAGAASFAIIMSVVKQLVDNHPPE